MKRIFYVEIIHWRNSYFILRCIWGDDDLVYQIRYIDNNGEKRLKVVRSDKEPIAWAKRFPEQICSTHPESGFF